MDDVLVGYTRFVGVVRHALFWLAVAAAVIAALDWLVRTRRISPFGSVARFVRRFVDPVMAPVERRIVRAGGVPTTAPWWTLVGIVVGGLLLVWLLDFLGGLLGSLAVGLQSPSGMGRLLIAWAFSLVRLALIVRVVTSWFSISPYSRWVRWSFVLTEWMLVPLRRVIPPFGPMDVTPLVAFLLLAIVQQVVGA